MTNRFDHPSRGWPGRSSRAGGQDAERSVGRARTIVKPEATFMNNRVRQPSRSLFSRLAMAALATVALGAQSGCTREFFRDWANQDVSEVIFEKSRDPRWRLDMFSVEPPSLSRFADPYDPDVPPAPPDDYASEVLSPVPQWPENRLLVPVEGTGYLDLLESWRTNTTKRDAEDPATRDDNAPVPDSGLTTPKPESSTPPPSTRTPFAPPLGTPAPPVHAHSAGCDDHARCDESEYAGDAEPCHATDHASASESWDEPGRNIAYSSIRTAALESSGRSVGSYAGPVSDQGYRCPAHRDAATPARHTEHSGPDSARSTTDNRGFDDRPARRARARPTGPGHLARRLEEAPWRAPDLKDEDYKASEALMAELSGLIMISDTKFNVNEESGLRARTPPMSSASTRRSGSR